MASLKELAPELRKIVDEAAVVDFVTTKINEAPPPVPRTITDLKPAELAGLKKWLMWFGMEKKPAGLPDFIQWPPKRVARRFGMTEAYVVALRAERAALVGEVQTYAGDAFKAHARIVSLSYDKDLTITGKEFLSVAGGAMGVRLERPGGASITRTKAAIEADGGTFTNTEIVVKAATLPVVLEDGDLAAVIADGLASETVALVIAPDPDPDPVIEPEDI